MAESDDAEWGYQEQVDRLKVLGITREYKVKVYFPRAEDPAKYFPDVLAQMIHDAVNHPEESPRDRGWADDPPMEEFIHVTVED